MEMLPKKPYRTLDLHVDPDPLEVDWAAEHLAALPVVITMHDTREVNHFFSNGEWFRHGGKVTVTWEEGTMQRFRIHLDRGATGFDLKWLKRRVEAARAGLFGERHGWRQSTDGIWYFRWGAGVSGPISAFEDMTPIAVCDEPWCLEQIHETDGPPVHVGERVDSDDWMIEVTQCGSDPWELYVELSTSTLTVAQAADLVNDLRWASGSVAKLNAPRAVA